MKRLDAQLCSMLCRHLWLGYRDWNQKAGTVSIFDLVRKRQATSATHGTANDAERAAEQRMRRLANCNLDDR